MTGNRLFHINIFASTPQYMLVENKFVEVTCIKWLSFDM